MKRPPRPSLVTTTLPALATLLGACQSSGPRYAPNPPAPHDPPPPPLARDAGGALSLEPTLIDPHHIPNIPMAGAPMPVTAMPPAPSPAPSLAPSAAPSAAPAPAAPMAAAPAPMGATAGLAPGVYLVHNHPPGTPCRPVSQTEIEQALQRAGQR
jgi:hypothetical protein